MTKSYVGWIKAKSGNLLLGGVPRQISSRFATKDSAERWLAVAVEINKEAGRMVDYAMVKETPRQPEIDS